jgi:hypothetical protein
MSVFWLVFLSLPIWVGCEGCRSDGGGENASETDPSAPTSDFTFGGAQPLPMGDSPGQMGLKPGHWFTATETIRSNRGDVRGTLRQGVESPPPPPRQDQLDSELPPLDPSAPKPAVRFPLVSERPAVLPKQRTRRLESRLLAAAPPSFRRGSGALLGGQLFSGGQSSVLETGRRAVKLLEPQEYFFVILTKRPERFSSLQSADWVRPPVDDNQFNTDVPTNYRLVLPKSDGVLPLAETMLDWTSTAVLLWDDLEPTALTAEQTRAISDWIHFGGRLIVNGPAAGAAFGRSELAGLLPISIEGSGELEPASVESLLVGWSVAGDNSIDQQAALVRERTGRLFTEGTAHPSAIAVRDCADLVWSRRVGRGQVVVARFDLTSDWVLGWRSRDSFFNAALLGRPGRRYVKIEDAFNQRYVTDAASVSAGPLVGQSVDATINSGFRLIGRDGRLTAIVGEPQSDGRTATAVDDEITGQTDSAMRSTAVNDFVSHPVQGVGGWRDDSDVATLTLESLRAESGVAIPPRSFVMQALAIYLVVLIPLNYIVFWLVGRLEWAWLAVPVIGLGGAAWIARGASLDVGLARSRTEIAILEVHGDYPRGHLTRFVSLYNSLSRRYDLAFDSPDAAAAPVGILGKSRGDDDSSGPVTIRYGYGDGPVLAGLSVASNRTRIFHAEQVIDLGGSVVLADDSLRNGTSFDLMDAWLVRKSADGEIAVAALGRCDAGSRVRVRWTDAPVVGPVAGLGDSLPLRVDRLMGPLSRADSLPAGSTRLVARCESPMPGLSITPEAAQQNVGTVVVVHLELPPVRIGDGDENLMPDRLEKQRRNQEQAASDD